jgi:hypothetical protein
MTKNALVKKPYTPVHLSGQSLVRTLINFLEKFRLRRVKAAANRLELILRGKFAWKIISAATIFLRVYITWAILWELATGNILSGLTF